MSPQMTAEYQATLLDIQRCGESLGWHFWFGVMMISLCGVVVYVKEIVRLSFKERRKR